MPKLAYYVHVLDSNEAPHVFGPEDDMPAWARKKITNPSAWADGDAPDTDPDPAGGEGKGKDDGGDQKSEDTKETYTDSRWTKDALEAEVEKRNEGRDDDDKIEVGGKGNKPDLQAALVADDAVQADNDA